MRTPRPNASDLPPSRPDMPSTLNDDDSSDHQPPGLVVGNYCHDVLFLDGHVLAQSLGGSISFISNVLDYILPSTPIRYISKVGPDFPHSVPHPPTVTTSPTTLFHALFHSSPARPDRLLRRVRPCDPIDPLDLPPSLHRFAVAAGVAGEISPATLSRMLDLCPTVFVDAQAILRTFDPVDGTVRLIPLKDTGFSRLLPRIAAVKASADEVDFVDVQEARRWCVVAVTRGGEGCCVYWRDREVRIPAFPARQVDPTGAGDSFLGGFVAGLVRGLGVADAALLGNFYGSLTVRVIGVPKFHPLVLQAVRNILEQKVSDSCRGLFIPECSPSDFELDKEFQTSLGNVSRMAEDGYIMAQDVDVDQDKIDHRQRTWLNSDGEMAIPKENGGVI